MALYMIGIGLNDEKDISVKGLELIKKADKVYLENYTSILDCSIEDLEKFYGKEIILADRTMIENEISVILEEAKEKNIAVLIVGDVLVATTHIGILLEAKEKRIDVEVIHNSSIFNAIGDVGLFSYEFGKITSIPFGYENVEVPIKVFHDNYKLGYHTLFLLDLDPKNDKYLEIPEAAKYLIDKGIDPELISIGCARMGSENKEIKVAKLKDLAKSTFKQKLHCLIIPGKMHFIEEEAIERWKEQK